MTKTKERPAGLQQEAATLTIEDIKNRLDAEYPHGVELVFTDYQDNLSSCPEVIEEVVRTGFADNWLLQCDLSEHEWQSMEQIGSDTFTSEEWENIRDDDDLMHTFSDWCYEHDTSDPVSDMIHNTGRVWLYYDLALSVDACAGTEDITAEAQKIARHLRISYTTHKADLRELVVNASYGGELVVLWSGNLSTVAGPFKHKYIKFENPYIAIMDRGNGSGHDVQLPVELTVELDRRLLHSDDGDAGYSYATDVCGLVSSYYVNDPDFTDEKGTNKVVKLKNKQKQIEEKQEYADQQAAYIKTYKAGGCTYGDMDIKRHEKTPYRNEYPCGNQCEKCGTFWID